MIRRIPARPLGTLALFLGSVVFALAVGEGLLRIAKYRYMPLKIVAGAHDQRALHAFEDRHFEYDPELIWSPRKGYDIFNTQGLRGPILEVPKPRDQFRIIAVGDSNTLGWGGISGPSWPTYLAEILARRDPRAVVANAGVWGYASFQGLRRLRHCLSFEPDLVLVSFGSNDAVSVPVPDRMVAEQRSGQGPVSRRVLGLRLAQLSMALLDRLQAGRTAGVSTQRVPLPEYRENLAEMIRLARQNGTQIVFLTRPYVSYLGEALPPKWWKLLGADYNVATVDVASRFGAPVIDVYTYFKDRNALFADESHFTEEGHRAAAAVIAQELSPYLD